MNVIPANAGIQTSYTYSGDGRRTSSNAGGTVVKYIYDGLTPLIERDASDTTKAVYTRNPLSIGGIGGLISSIEPALPAAEHIPEVAIDRGRVLNIIFNTYYYHDSNLGNVNQITDSTGQVIQTYDYDAFGNITNQSGSLTQAYRYKTKEYSPETGLIFFGARYYNPLIGRFITKDPLGMVDGPNQYTYCWDDPINKIDPWGLARDEYVPDSSKHGGPHIDRYDSSGKNVGRYRPDGTPIPHKGKLPPKIPMKDLSKFWKAVKKLGKIGVVVGVLLDLAEPAVAEAPEVESEINSETGPKDCSTGGN